MATKPTTSFLASLFGASVEHLELKFQKNEARKNEARKNEERKNKARENEAARQLQLASDGSLLANDIAVRSLLAIDIDQLIWLERTTRPDQGDEDPYLYTDDFRTLLEVEKNKYPCFTSQDIESAARLALAEGDSVKHEFLEKFLTKKVRQCIKTDAEAEKKSAVDAVVEQAPSKIDEDYDDDDGYDSYDEFYDNLQDSTIY